MPTRTKKDPDGLKAQLGHTPEQPKLDLLGVVRHRVLSALRRDDRGPGCAPSRSSGDEESTAQRA